MSQVTELFNKPFLELLFEAQQVHRQHFDPRQVQVSTLLSIKTGACPEDCKYCPQSARYKTGLESERLMEVEQVLDSARKAKNAGSTRFCMGAAWKNPNDRDMPYLEQMVKGVKEMGLEACMTLGTLNDEQAQRLAAAGWITTTTTSTPRRNFTATSSPPVPIRSAWIRWIKCVMRGSKSAPAVSWAGRNGERPRGPAAATGEPADAAGKRADQHAGEGQGHAAGG
jgi:hypothetical protein